LGCADHLHDEIIGGGKVELGQVQLDELCINSQLGKVWMMTAMSVFSRLFLGGVVNQQRDKTRGVNSFSGCW
jgi:hypothetical protein